MKALAGVTDDEAGMVQGARLEAQVKWDGHKEVNNFVVVEEAETISWFLNSRAGVIFSFAISRHPTLPFP